MNRRLVAVTCAVVAVLALWRWSRPEEPPRLPDDDAPAVIAVDEWLDDLWLTLYERSLA